jgi:hypothetical protein
LHNAVVAVNETNVRALLNGGANPFMKTDFGDTPRDLAYKNPVFDVEFMSSMGDMAYVFDVDAVNNIIGILLRAEDDWVDMKEPDRDSFVSSHYE